MLKICIILLILLMESTLLPGKMEAKLSPSSKNIKQQEWALIYNQQAMEHKQLKVMERESSKQRKYQMKSELDRQLISKSEQELQHKLEDQQFSQFLKKRITDSEIREKNEKLQRLLQIRRIDQENYSQMQQRKIAKLYPNQQTELGILELIRGQKSQQQVKQEKLLSKRRLADALDLQIKIKEEEKLLKMHQEQEKEVQTNNYLDQFYQKRGTMSARYHQNTAIYNYYEKLQQQNAEKQREQDRKLIDEPIERKHILQRMKEQEKIRQQCQNSNQVKQSIEEQLRQKRERSQNQRKQNPEDNTNHIFSSLFRDKKDVFDKKQYFHYLGKQAEEQARNKKNLDYMNEQEYKLNINQLNKAVNGRYEHHNYIDRSVQSIGINPSKLSVGTMNLGSRNFLEDAIMVQDRLDQIRRQPKVI